MADDPTRATFPGATSAEPPDPLQPPPAVPQTLAWAEPGPPAPRQPAQPALSTAERPILGDDCWFLSGPTAAGKSSLAIRLARELRAEILSVDSMAVYTGLDVGTAKPTTAQRAAVPHHLIDVVPPSEPYSVALWLSSAARAVADCRARSRRILFVGGTPLYLRALRDGLAPLPPADDDLRTRLMADAAAHGLATLHARLATVDPHAAARIHPHDAKRIIRALEVAELTSRPLSAAFAPAPHPVFESQFLVLDIPRAALRDRIDRRVARMFAAGLVEETAAALEAPGGIGPTARQAAGYTEAIDLIEGRIDRAEAIRRTQQRTRQLAKRQLTWLRSFRRAIWLSA